MREKPETRWYAPDMTELGAIPTSQMVVGRAADHLLDEMTGVTQSRHGVFIPTLNAARNGYGVPGRLATKNAKGLRAWLDGTEEVRLRLEPYGWNLPEHGLLDSAGIVFSPDRRVAIALTAGDGATGSPDYIPQVRYPRGLVTSQFVQGTMFPEVVAERNTAELWFLLHWIDRDGWRAELSQAAELHSGRVSRWGPRIQIVADSPTDGAKQSRDEVPDLPSPPVRWRESA